MGKIKRKLAALALAAGLAVGGGAVVQLATPEAAEAYTRTNCQSWSGYSQYYWGFDTYQTCRMIPNAAERRQGKTAYTVERFCTFTGFYVSCTAWRRA